MARYEHGGNIYKNSIVLDFSANINPFGMPESVGKAALEGVLDCVHYPDPNCATLKKAICDMEKMQGNVVAENQIVCGNGASDLMYRLVQCLRPKKAAVFTPGFQEYEQALRSLPDIEICKIGLDRKNGFLPGVQDISALPQDAEVLFLCNPGNPTGLLLPEEVVQAVLRKVKREKLFVVMDESFLDFVMDDKRETMTKIIANYDKICVIKAFTKMFAIPGRRLGYGLSGNTRLIEQMEESSQPWSVSVPAQRAGVAACYEEKYVEKTRAWLVKERAYVKERLERMGCTVIPGEANFLMFSLPLEKRFSGKESLEQALLKQGILIRSCSNFEGLSENDYRMAIRKREENDRLLVEIENWLSGNGEKNFNGLK